MYLLKEKAACTPDPDMGDKERQQESSNCHRQVLTRATISARQATTDASVCVKEPTALAKNSSRRQQKTSVLLRGWCVLYHAEPRHG